MAPLGEGGEHISELSDLRGEFVLPSASSTPKDEALRWRSQLQADALGPCGQGAVRVCPTVPFWDDQPCSDSGVQPQ